MWKHNSLVLALLAVSFGVTGLRAQSPAAVPELPAGPMQAKVTIACTECHESRIIVQQRLSKAAWTKEVDKMTKWGAVVDPQDREAMIEYLSTNFGTDRPPYVADRAAATKPAKK